jgi:replicative DNA helicase
MRSVARRLKRENGLDLIIVDYLQLLAPPTRAPTTTLVQQVTEISRSLKHLARELDVPVLALSQLSRAVEQRGGRLASSDLRDSGSIEQDADVVMFIHREDMTGKETLERNQYRRDIDREAPQRPGGQGRALLRRKAHHLYLAR